MKGEILLLSEKEKMTEDSKMTALSHDAVLITDGKLQQIYDYIAHQFHAERIRQNVTVIQLEAMTGIDRTAIYRMENCKRRFGFGNIIRMCYALGISLDELYRAPLNWINDGEE